MDMDGWGPPWLKFDSYRDYIVAASGAVHRLQALLSQRRQERRLVAHAGRSAPHCSRARSTSSISDGPPGAARRNRCSLPLRSERAARAQSPQTSVASHRQRRVRLLDDAVQSSGRGVHERRPHHVRRRARTMVVATRSLAAPPRARITCTIADRRARSWGRTSTRRRRAWTIRVPRPGSRANAGWLYLAQSSRSLHPTRSDELTITLGVTGPPSLARLTQNLFHDIGPEFNRPTDWTRQIRLRAWRDPRLRAPAAPRRV